MRSAILFLSAALLAAPAMAQDRPNLQPLPDIPPPPGMADNIGEPEITITQRGGDRVEEHRIKGRLYMIKVTPPHGKPYYLVDQKGNGQYVRYDDLAPNFQVPMWVITEF